MVLFFLLLLVSLPFDQGDNPPISTLRSNVSKALSFKHFLGVKGLGLGLFCRDWLFLWSLVLLWKGSRWGYGFGGVRRAPLVKGLLLG